MLCQNISDTLRTDQELTKRKSRRHTIVNVIHLSPCQKVRYKAPVHLDRCLDWRHNTAPRALYTLLVLNQAILVVLDWCHREMLQVECKYVDMSVVFKRLNIVD
jgi:hypothetical protein